MKPYEPHTFTIPTLDGISTESVNEHIDLYKAYVKNFNALSTLIGEYSNDATKNALAIAEIIRRRSFEFGGMRLHELYFAQFENGATPPSSESAFITHVTEQFGSFESLTSILTQVALMRGPGWSLLYWDATVSQFDDGFAGEQHQGHFAGLPIIVALDVWEHAFLKDYGALGKAKYLDAFFKNINWKVVEERFAVTVK